MQPKLGGQGGGGVVIRPMPKIKHRYVRPIAMRIAQERALIIPSTSTIGKYATRSNTAV